MNMIIATNSNVITMKIKMERYCI